MMWGQERITIYGQDCPVRQVSDDTAATLRDLGYADAADLECFRDRLGLNVEDVTRYRVSRTHAEAIWEAGVGAVRPFHYLPDADEYRTALSACSPADIAAACREASRVSELWCAVVSLHDTDARLRIAAYREAGVTQDKNCGLTSLRSWVVSGADPENVLAMYAALGKTKWAACAAVTMLDKGLSAAQARAFGAGVLRGMGVDEAVGLLSEGFDPKHVKSLHNALCKGKGAISSTAAPPSSGSSSTPKSPTARKPRTCCG